MVHLMEALPVTGSGKVLKRALRDMYGAPRLAAAARTCDAATHSTGTLRLVPAVTQQRVGMLVAALSSVYRGARIAALQTGSGRPATSACVALVCPGPSAAAEVRQQLEGFSDQ